MVIIQCLVDNKTVNAETFQSEHGVAFVIEVPAGKVLFDTGKSGAVLLHNAKRMQVDLSQVDALAISHAHNDHTGGLKAVLPKLRDGLPLHAHPDLFRERFTTKKGKARRIGLSLTQADLAQYVTLRLSPKPVQILPGLWTTGEIYERNQFEGRSPNHFILAGDDHLPDPYRDDMALVAETPSGLIVICGCCHAGLLNTLAHAQRVFNRKIIAIIGGTHLESVDPLILENAICQGLVSQGHIPDLYLNHCSGERPLAILAKMLGEKVHPCPAGSIIRFE